MKYLEILGASIVALLVMLWKAFTDGKKSVINEENKEVSKDVQDLNKIKQDVNRLSDVDLDKRMSKWKKPRD